MSIKSGGGWWGAACTEQQPRGRIDMEGYRPTEVSAVGAMFARASWMGDVSVHCVHKKGGYIV